jgi:hypothetical protein
MAHLRSLMSLLRLMDFTDKIALINNSFNTLHLMIDSIQTRHLVVEFLGKAFKRLQENQMVFILELRDYSL